jgi:hypothetical protein
MLQVSLFEFKQHLVRQYGNSYRPDWDRWKNLLKRLGKSKATKTPLPLEIILDDCGLRDALWTLKAVDGHRNAMRLYACYCARKALPFFEQRYPEDIRLRNALDTAERYCRGEADKAALSAARAAITSINRKLEKDPDITAYLMEELYFALNPVALLVGAEPFRYTRSRRMDAGDISRVVWDSLRAVRYYVKHAVCQECAEKNAELNATDPGEAFLRAYYTNEAFEVAYDTVMDAAASAAAVMAEDTRRILAANNITTPLRKTMQDAALNAIFQSVWKTATASIYDAVAKSVQADFISEFRRLCRLEGPYAAAVEKGRGCPR